MPALPHRPLGRSGLNVSLFALGSWRTFERIPREQGLAVMQAARESGITFLDDARYNDETGQAPIPTGYSEIVFGELFRAAGWVRDEVVVANKLWWEFWPQQDAAAELDSSLGRMGLDHIDLIYTMQPPRGAVDRRLGRAGRRARDVGPRPRLGHRQLAGRRARPRRCGPRATSGCRCPQRLNCRTAWYAPTGSRTRRWRRFSPTPGWVWWRRTCSPVARSPASTSTAAPVEPTPTSTPAIVAGKQRAAALVELAREWDVTPTSLAFSFALGHPRLASVLFGATSPEQVHENVMSLEVFMSLDDGQRAQLNQLAST